MPGPEYTQVELPFIEQLQALGWDYLEGDTQAPDFTERTSFRQVLLTGRLREARAQAAEIGRVDFWRNSIAQGELRSRLIRRLDSLDLLPFDQLQAVADQLVQTARANHVRLVGE